VREGLPGHGGGQLGVSDTALTDGCAAIFFASKRRVKTTLFFSRSRSQKSLKIGRGPKKCLK
jgi:hypothetical protein